MHVECYDLMEFLYLCWLCNPSGECFATKILAPDIFNDKGMRTYADTDTNVVEYGYITGQILCTSILYITLPRFSPSKRQTKSRLSHFQP